MVDIWICFQKNRPILESGYVEISAGLEYVFTPKLDLHDTFNLLLKI